MCQTIATNAISRYMNENLIIPSLGIRLFPLYRAIKAKQKCHWHLKCEFGVPDIDFTYIWICCWLIQLFYYRMCAVRHFTYTCRFYIHTKSCHIKWLPTCMTRILRPVSAASCSRIWRVGFGVALNDAFNTSSCLAFIVVLGPRRLFPPFSEDALSLLLFESLLSTLEQLLPGLPSAGSWDSGPMGLKHESESESLGSLLVPLPTVSELMRLSEISDLESLDIFESDKFKPIWFEFSELWMPNELLISCECSFVGRLHSVDGKYTSRSTDVSPSWTPR